MKIHFKKTVCSVLLAASLASVPFMANASGIPVFDGGAAAQRTQNFVQQMAEMAKQLTQLKQQYEQQVKQFKAMTGSRNIGNLLKDTFKDQIPSEWSAVYDGAKNIDYKSMINSKAYKADGADKLLVQNQEMLSKVFAETKKQLGNIENLMNQINTTQDIKAAADLQNRIAAEQAKIANNQTKLDMFDRLFKQQQVIEQRRYAARESCMAKHIRDGNYSACN